MILSAQTIRLTQPPLVTPFHERAVSNGMTFGLSSHGYDVRIDQTVVLHPAIGREERLERALKKIEVSALLGDHTDYIGELARRALAGSFTLASTVEYFNMRSDIAGIVHDKSTWARRGVAVQNTVIEAGWRGFLTLELTNHGTETVEIPAGSPIAQIVFHRLDEPTEQPYSGKYQDQGRGPKKAIEEKR